MNRPHRLLSIAVACAAACTTLTPIFPLTSGSAYGQTAPAAGTDQTPAAGAATPVAPGTPAAPATPVAPAAPGADMTPPAAGTPAAPADQSAVPTLAADSPLRQDADDFWHYARMGRYDQAKAVGQKILSSGATDSDIRLALEAAATSRQEDLYDRLLDWQQIPALKDTATQMLAKIRTATEALLTNPAYINKQIERLSSTERGYLLGLQELRRTGQYAVPFMIDYLRDPAKQQYHAAIRQALIDMGRQVLNPLVAATEMEDNDTKITVINVLGAIGYDASVPYLARIANSPNATDAVRDAATRALERIGSGDPKTLNAAQLFYDLAQKFYYSNSVIGVEKRNPATYVWTWDAPNHRLGGVAVPPRIFNDVMAMRECEYSLSLNASMGKAVSLWLASDFKREIDLPEGQKDPSRPENSPSAHYFGVASGTQYLEQVVSRALRDRNSAVALASIKSLADIAGESNLFDEAHQPMIDALKYPDRLVRYEAALALAGALPQKPFAGQEDVVPTLADALAQTGKPTALVVTDSQDQLNKILDALHKANYTAQGATNPDAAMAMVGMLPSVDAVVISERLPEAQMKNLLSMLSQNVHTERVPRVFVVASSLSPWTAASVDNPLVATALADDLGDLNGVIQSARQRSGSLPLDEKTATEYALRAADMLGKLAISRGQVFDLSVAQQGMIAALNDPRAEVVKAVAKVVGLLNSKEAQQSLCSVALDDKTPDEVKPALFRALATSARFFGNFITRDQVDALQKIVETSTNPEILSAAAEARGALNLPADEAQKLIIHHSQIPSIEKK